MLVENTQTVILCIAVSGIWERSERREVIEPVKGGLVGDGVNATEEEIDIVGFSGTEGRGKFATDEVCDCGRGEIDVIAHRVKLSVGLDEFCKLNWEESVVCILEGWIRHTCISCFSRKRHQGMIVQCSCLVIARFKNSCTSHTSLASTDESEVLASYSQ